MKVKQFLKRRIFPVMLTLVIVFFSVVIPCARVEASSLVVPAPVAGFSYYDLVSSAFLSTGFDCPLQKSDGTRTTFGKEMYDELCDTFDLWCNDNFGTTDASEIKEQLRALPGNIVNGTVTVTKALWDALYQFGSDAYDYCSTHFQGGANSSEYFNSEGRLTWAYIYDVCGCIPSNKSFSDTESLATYPTLIGKTSDGYYFFVTACSETDRYFTFLDNRFYTLTSNGVVNNYRYFSYWCNGSRSSWIYELKNSDFTILDVRGASWVDDYTASNWKDVADANADVKWPVQDLAIDKVVSGPTTWEDAIAKDIIVPGEAADTAVIGLTHTDEESDVIPGTATGDVTEDPAVSDDAKPDVNEIVSSEEISSFPEKVKNAVGDVTNLFPFCIPFDIVRLVRGMEAEQKPPIWHFEYYFKEIDYTFVIDIDMTDYEKYIKIFRAGIVIFWIIALMLITIRFSSGIVKD